MKYTNNNNNNNNNKNYNLNSQIIFLRCLV